MVMDGRWRAVAGRDILQRCVIQKLAHGRIRPSSGCRSDACDVDHFNKLSDEPRSGLWGGGALKGICRQQHLQRSSSRSSSPKVDTLVRETRIREEKQHQGSACANRQHAFFNVCMGSPGFCSSALLHSDDQDVRLILREPIT